MWRRLCIDVDVDGTLLGASVEIYSDQKHECDSVLVMEPGWVDHKTLVQAIEDLERSGWIQPPLRLVTFE